MSQVWEVIVKHKLEGKVAGLVTDTPSVMRLAWKKIQLKDPKILCIACICHVLDLLLKDLAKIAEVRFTIGHEIWLRPKRHSACIGFEGAL